MRHTFGLRLLQGAEAALLLRVCVARPVARGWVVM